MRLDRIVIDFFDWVRVIFHSEPGWKKRPFTFIRGYKRERGYLKLVDRETSRAVRTWILSPGVTEDEIDEYGIPVRKTKSKLDFAYYDYYLLCDVLDREIVSAPQPKSTAPKPKKLYNFEHRMTHRITVQMVSRFVLPDGSFNTRELWSKDYDFVGKSGTQDWNRYAREILDDIAFRFSDTHYPLDQFAWEHEIQMTQYEALALYLPSRLQEKQPKLEFITVRYVEEDKEKIKKLRTEARKKPKEPPPGSSIKKSSSIARQRRIVIRH